MKLIRSKFPIKLSAVRIRRRLITIMVHLTLLFTLATALQAGSKPDFLSNAVSGIPAGGLTYEVWFTNTCIPDTTGTCKCDAGVDKQNDCVSTIDTDGDGILDSGPDEDGDGVVDVVDLDFTTNWGNWATVPNVESVSFNLQRSVDVYVNDWGLRQPFWTEVTERDVYVYDIDSRGSASSDGSGIELNTATMLKTAPGPRSTVLHEVWHAVQHAYNATSGVDDWFVEGQARFMQDKVFFDMDVNAGSRYVGAVKNYLKNPTVPKDFDANADGKENTVPVGLLGAKYEAALWWTYLTEQAGSGFVGTAGEGIEFIEDVLEWSPDPLNIKGQLAVDLTLLARIGRSFDLSFWDFTIANYTKDYNVATLDRSLIDDRDPQIVLDYQDELSGEYGAVAKAEEFTDSELMIGQGGRVDPVTYTAVASIPPTLEVTGEMPQYGALYYEGELPDAATCPVAHWAAAGDANSRLYHSWVLRAQSPTVGAPDDLVDLQRHHGEEFSITLLNRDEYTYMTGIVASNHAPEGFDWTMWCSSTPPDLTITGPHVDAPAAVGDPADAGRFKVWLAVTDGSLDDPISGLDWEQDFAVTVGGEEAEILNGEEVGNEYWLVVQAPNVPNTTLGDTHDLHVELVMGGADDDAPNAVLYDIIPKDQVLVIDRSASMNQGSKFTAAKSAARIYADTTQLGDQLGVVSFSDAATTVFPLTPIQDQNDNAGDRASARLAIDAIPLGNQTSIGAGLAQGQALLSTVPSGNIWNMVLLSDGEENVSPSVDAVIGNIASAGTKVHAIAFGPESDTELMRSIAAATCGLREEDHCFHALNANATGMLVHAAAQDQQQQLNDLADIYRQIGDSVHGHQRLWQGSSATVSGSSFSVKIDETGGREGFFAFNWADPANALNVTITGPAGITFTQLEDGQNHTVFYVNEVKAGKYQVDLGGSGNWVGSLSARVVKGTELHAYAHTPSDSSRVLGMPIQLQVSLTDDNGPAAGAAVTAVVGRPGGVEETITLYDDGKAPHDDAPNDGIYGHRYDRINFREGPEENRQYYTFAISAHGDTFDRYKVLTYRPRDAVYYDSDQDNVLDTWELRYENTDPTVDDDDVDPDHDGLTNIQEFFAGTNPDHPDTDRGGETDGSEVAKGRNPLDPSDDKIPPVVDFWVDNNDASVTLHYNPRSEVDGVRLWRSSDGITYNAIAIFPATSGVITDTGLTNGEAYLYKLQALARPGIVGVPSPPLLALPDVDTDAPESTVFINSGAYSTTSEIVTLTFLDPLLPDGTSDITHVQVRNRPNLAAAQWRPFTPSMNWRLRPDPETGIAFVYARFRDAAGNVSDHIESAGIRYEPTDPQNTDDETRAGGTLGELPTNLPYRSFLPFVAK